ncbi:hypothetical protein GCE86_09000 [Micromonospora terminaliae]|uniref:Uncharacterized protein n=1 Tax=Micromonospora terminaliae TaxID=1914461 RepID=A0AAJ2ZDC6_9ACTN|nr:hypothetical protein [Micromonospora terminaliae]NES28077.1 hypothetical protein [Micromonospora terminaliae]QGL47172.1 hypothetical protein GCE86_09000 [Micromonospora terminaliae]
MPGSDVLMPNPYASYELALRPDHRIVILRDIECDAAVGDTSAIEHAVRDVAAGNRYALYLHTVQNLLATHVWVETWTGPPADEGVDTGWTSAAAVDLDCPTGLLVLGDGMSASIDGIDPPEGPGRYRIAVYHQGRERAELAYREVVHAMGPRAGRAESELQARYGAVEKYLLRMWWQQALPDTDDDDN